VAVGKVKLMSDQSPANDYKIGYCRPPRSTQFKAGTSGNRRGRPKGMKSVAKLLEEALSRRVTIQENGRERKMRAQDVIIRGLVNDAARRDSRALKLLFALIDRYGITNEREIDLATLNADDQNLIDSYLSRHTQSLEMHSTAAIGIEADLESAADCGEVGTR
jgi:Family of unknown function (DUF5681)